MFVVSDVNELISYIIQAIGGITKTKRYILKNELHALLLFRKAGPIPLVIECPFNEFSIAESFFHSFYL